MARISVLALAFFLAACATPTEAVTPKKEVPPMAQRQAPMCATQKEITGVLFKKYKERPTAIGAVSPVHVATLWKRRDDSTWTLTLTRADGLTCIVTHGVNWKKLDGPSI